MNVLPAVLMGQPYSRTALDRRVVVTDPDVGDVGVRWQLGRPEPWRCAACGPMSEAACAHTFAAALVLAEQILGLVRIPELSPTEGVPE